MTTDERLARLEAVLRQFSAFGDLYGEPAMVDTHAVYADMLANDKELAALAAALRPHLLKLDDYGEDEWEKGSFYDGHSRAYLWLPNLIGRDRSEIQVHTLPPATDYIHGINVRAIGTAREDDHDTTQRELVERIDREAANCKATAVYVSNPKHRHLGGDISGLAHWQPRWLQHWCYIVYLKIESATRMAPSQGPGTSPTTA